MALNNKDLMQIIYDDDADVLYISFYKPQKANDSVMEDNIIYHYRDEKLVGITVLRAAETHGFDRKMEERDFFLENLLADLSPEYLASIKEARQDYREGRTVSHEEAF